MAITLKAARVNANLLQSEVATIIGVDRTTISKWENGTSAPDVIQFKKLSELYHVTFDDIIFLT